MGKITGENYGGKLRGKIITMSTGNHNLPHVHIRIRQETNNQTGQELDMWVNSMENMWVNSMENIRVNSTRIPARFSRHA